MHIYYSQTWLYNCWLKHVRGFNIKLLLAVTTISYPDLYSDPDIRYPDLYSSHTISQTHTSQISHIFIQFWVTGFAPKTINTAFWGKTKIQFMFSIYFAAAAAKSLQLCPTLCDLIDGNPPGSTVPGILQARTLEWAAISIYFTLSLIPINMIYVLIVPTPL